MSDQNACTIPTTVYTITEPTPLALTTATVSSTCSLSNGSATVSVTGGTPYGGSPAYLFLWNNQSIDLAIVKISFGNYL